MKGFTVQILEEDNQKKISIGDDFGYYVMTPEDAVKFATEVINKAYPLTAAVQRRTRQAKLAEPINKAIKTVQQGFRSSFNQGCHRR